MGRSSLTWAMSTAPWETPVNLNIHSSGLGTAQIVCKWLEENHLLECLLLFKQAESLELAASVVV